MKKRILVKELFDDLKETLSLTLVAGEGGLYKYVENHRIQKPGLALAGFLQHVHTERVQVFGETEISYLNHIGDAEAKKKNQRISCFRCSVCCCY